MPYYECTRLKKNTQAHTLLEQITQFTSIGGISLFNKCTPKPHRNLRVNGIIAHGEVLFSCCNTSIRHVC